VSPTTLLRSLVSQHNDRIGRTSQSCTLGSAPSARATAPELGSIVPIGPVGTQRGALPTVLAALILVTYVGLASTFSLVVPPWEAPDEPAHFQYIQQLVLTRTFPVDHRGDLGESHQPPLYYLLAAIATLPANLADPTGGFLSSPQFMWAGNGGTQINAARHPSSETFPFQGQALGLHLARAFSVLLGLGTLSLILAIGWEVFPKRRSIGLSATALAAFNPQFLFVSASVNNDNLATLIATAIWWRSIRALKDPTALREWLLLGALLGLGILTKLSDAACLVVVLILLVGLALRRRSFGLLVRGATALAITGLPVAGWWIARNVRLYGNLGGWSMDPQNLQMTALQPTDLLELGQVQFRSFWGVFGWMNVPAPPWFFWGIGLLIVVSCAGWLAWLARGKLVGVTSQQWAVLAMLVLAAGAVELGIVATVASGCNGACYQGRFLFPALAPSTLLLAIGLGLALPQRVGRVIQPAIALLLAIGSIYLLVAVLRPAYVIVPLPKWALRDVANRADVTFGPSFRLRGYQVEPDGSTNQLAVTLYWQAIQTPDFDYSAYVHLVDASGKLIAQADQSPGAGRNYPPTDWLPGDIIADEHQIALPKVGASGSYTLVIGVYNWQNGQVLARQPPTNPANNAFVLGSRLRYAQGQWLAAASN
jgi:4-amino-4-deoxy-L-arabinose transferase-like glycosyltransferase